jgi:hypothetical protein
MIPITIFAILGSIIMFAVLYSKKTIKQALLLSLIWGLIAGFGYMTPGDYRNPDKISPELKRQVTNMGLTMEQFADKVENRTPLEKFGDYAVTLFFFTAFFVWIITGGDLKGCDEEVKPVFKKCLALLIVVSLYFLSLYLGLKIPIVATIKARKKKAPSKEKAPPQNLTEPKIEKQFQL